ncbi:MAG: lamin tail domain-containing protein, partial [Candidatus Latescibacteria bacterium]|nr:lamin tail domain-containing protein [Candidatus Latescibacterota bacterium]
ITVTDDSAASDSDTFVLTVLPRPRIAINEVLCDPPLGDEGDANRDGVRSGSEDEFVELMNLESVSVDLSGWTLSDGASSPFAFPSGTQIAPGEHLVLFGGGAPTGFAGQVFTDDGTLGGGLSNSGDSVYLINPAGPDTIAALTYTGWGTDQSYTRHPEGAGDFVPHTSLPGRGRFSPGSARPTLTAITVLPAGITITVGGKEPFTAFGNFSDGGTEDITAQVSWSASDRSVAVVSSDGVVHAEGPGSTEVQAAFGGISGSGTVTVEPPPAPPPTYAPALSDIPDQAIREGAHFEKIFLDLYVNDEDHGDSDLTWTYSGNEALSVSLSSERAATLIASSADWNGSET